MGARPLVPALASLLAAAAAAPAAACSVCFGDPASPMSLGIKSGVFVLLGVTAVVLGWFVAVILTLRRRAQRWEERKKSLAVVGFPPSGEPAHSER